MKKKSFFKESIRNWKTVGTLRRSSKYLCEEMCKHIDFQNGDRIIELGSGDGVITHYLLDGMKPDAKLLAFEIHKEFCTQLEAIDDERLEVVKDSAEHVLQHMDQRNWMRYGTVNNRHSEYSRLPVSLKGCHPEAFEHVSKLAL